MDWCTHVLGDVPQERDFLAEATSIMAGRSLLIPELDHLFAIKEYYESQLQILRASIYDDSENLREVHVLHGKEMP